MNLTAFTLGSVALLIKQYADIYRQSDLQRTLVELEPDLGIPRISQYDFIIVGGGTAGCLLASRLSENFHVLLLEKGGNPVPITYPMVFASGYNNDPVINDLYKMIPQDFYALETPGDKFVIVGRMLGGTGSHNDNIYNRGSPFDYQQLADLTGDSSYRYENMIPHFKKIENFIGILVSENERHLYGQGGPLQVTTLIPSHLLAWISAAKELNFPFADPNGHQIRSFSPIQQSTRNGVRDSSYTAYLKRAEGRRTLKILRYSEVDRILFQNGVAYGVAYKRHGIPQIAHARREVILSAGVFASPIILIKSGVGPKELLRDAGIDLVSDLPGVLKNLQYHPSLILHFTTEKGSPLNDIQFQTELIKFHSPQRQGNFSRVAKVQAFTLFSKGTDNHEVKLDWPDGHLVSTINETDSSIYDMVIEVTRPESVGEIVFNITAYKNGETDTVKLGNPDFKYLHLNDLDILVEGIFLSFKIYQDTESFKPLKLTLSETIPKACGNLVKYPTRFWECYAEQRTADARHPTGTCKMGRKEDQMAVVDSSFRVRGVKGLRVVDSSIFPKIPNTNTNAPVLVMAEKAVTNILQEISLSFYGR